jgi:endonuclease/exonuclease/phosphatase family metal-dependent hydrolase
MRRVLSVLFLGLALVFPAGAEEITITNWNLLNYSGNDGTLRSPYFRTVLSHIGPDVLVTQEMVGQAGVNHFLSNILQVIEPGEWAAGPYHDGYDTDNALFFRTSAVEVIASGWLDTALRDIDWWQIRLVESGEEVRLYSFHLKASQGSAEEAERLAECTILRAALDALDPGLPCATMGDYNVYGASEDAFQLLLSAGPGSLRDPIDRVGEWHDNAAFADVHTQSTRTSSFGGGATGGMDDRFDIILVSEELQDGGGLEIDPETYTAYGNDGAHFNQSIVSGENAAVPAEVAEALHQASDHLPVYALFRVEIATAIAGGSVPGAAPLGIAPNPFNATAAVRFTVAEPSFVRLVLHDAAGREVATLASGPFGAGTFERSWDGRDEAGREAASGVYFARLRAGDRTEVRKIILVR